MLALAGADDRSHELYARPLRERHYLVDYLVDALLAYLLAAFRAVRHTDARPEKAQIIVYLRHGADRGAWVFGGRLLVDGYRWGQAVDIVNVRLVHLAEEHARVGAEALHVAALAFGIYGIEREAGFSAAGEAGYHDQLVSRYLNVDIFQIVFSCAFYINTVLH